MPPLQGDRGFVCNRFYKHAVPTGLKRVLKIQSFWLSSGVVRKPPHRCQFRDFHSIFWQRFYRGFPPLGLGSLVAAHFYTDAVPLGLKRWLAVYKISVKIRCGWETAPTGPGHSARKLFLKFTPLARSKAHLQQTRCALFLRLSSNSRCACTYTQHR